MYKHTVFISYSSKDKGFAEKLAADLRASWGRSAVQFILYLWRDTEKGLIETSEQEDLK